MTKAAKEPKSSVFLFVVNVATLVGLVLTIVSLVLSAREIGQVKEQAKDLRRISDELTTKFFADFPNDLTKIIDLVKEPGAKQLDIMVDFVGYGQYSGPQEFEIYLAELKKLPQSTAVRMLIYSNEQADAARLLQFPPADLKPRNRQNNLSSILQIP